MIGAATPLQWLWPYMVTWYGFPIMLGWFVISIHAATKAALWAMDE